MHGFRDAKAMAKGLRRALAGRGMTMTHGECLELVARSLGVADWNTLASQIAAEDATERALIVPVGWGITRNTDARYFRAGLDPAVPGAALIERRAAWDGSLPDRHQFAALMQSVDAEPFREGRVRLSAGLRTQAVDRAAIWLRVDGAPGVTLRFDNMMQRPADEARRGTTDWTDCHAVLDVPAEAESMHFGFLLKGAGRVWARDFRLESVGAETRPTALTQRRYLPRPSNLDFRAPPTA